MKTSLLSDLFSFIKNPTYPETLNKNGFGKTFWDMIRLLALHYSLSFPLGILIAVLLTAFNYPIDQHSVVNLFTNEPWYVPLIIGGLLAPLIEELTFRMPLRFSYTNLAFFIPLAGLLLIQIAEELQLPFSDVFGRLVLDQSNMINVAITITTIVGLSLIVRFILTNVVKNDHAANFYRIHIRWIYYGTALSFGFTHLSNYQGIGNLLLLSPILVSPQIIGGLFWGYLRLHAGLGWAIANHSLYNLIGILPITILTFASERLQEFFKSPSMMTYMNLTNQDLTFLSILGWGMGTVFFILLVAIFHLLLEWSSARFANNTAKPQ